MAFYFVEASLATGTPLPLAQKPSAATSLTSSNKAFDAIWNHYRETHFIYDAKLERLHLSLGLIRSGWPQLLRAPAELFQFHAARDEDRIVSSICAFRDTSDTYVIQHAASDRHPTGMHASIRAILSSINADAGFEFAKMYFRPENRWPVRASRAIAEAIGPDRSILDTSAYLYCEPRAAWVDSAHQHRGAPSVHDLAPSSYGAAVALAIAAVGPLRAGALGFRRTDQDMPDLTLDELNARFLMEGMRRSRRVLAVEEDGMLAGLALCHVSDHVMNFSYLCSRTELLIHPDVRDRKRLVTALAQASIAESAARGDPLTVLLANPADVEAAVRGGFHDTRKQYSCFLWSREDERGAPSAIAGVDALYDVQSRIAARRGSMSDSLASNSAPS